MRRSRLVIAIGFAVFLFIGFSVLLARGLSGAGNERSQVRDVLVAQARGDAEAVLAELPDCRELPACVTAVRDRVERLERPGAVEILTYQPSVRFALTRRTGVGRVAWRVGGSEPVVQCVRVRREGPVTGAGVELVSVSDPIESDTGCA